MLATQLFPVGPCASGDLGVCDPEAAVAERAIAENVLRTTEGLSQVISPSIKYDFVIDGDFRETLLHPKQFGAHVWDPTLGRKRQATLEEVEATERYLEEQRREAAAVRARLTSLYISPEAMADILSWDEVPGPSEKIPGPGPEGASHQNLPPGEATGP